MTPAAPPHSSETNPLDVPGRSNPSPRRDRIGVIALDLDDTVWDILPADSGLPAEERWQSARPHARACAQIRQLARAGWTIAYVTGRERAFRELTRAQLDAAGLPTGALLMVNEWRGHAHLGYWKGLALRALQDEAAVLGLRVERFVGDQDSDAFAATYASVPFLHANDFREGMLPVPIAATAAPAPRSVVA